MSVHTIGAMPAPARKVGLPLGVGVFLLPYVFAWFTLRSGYSLLARAVSFGWLGVVALLSFSAMSSTGKVQPAASVAPAPTASAPVAKAPSSSPVPSAPGWTYQQSKDDMRDTVEHTASLDSDNRLQFAFPYSGGSTGTIVLRRSSKDGLDAMLLISKGQFTCHSFNDGHVEVKFDDGAIQHFGCTDAADGRSDIIFLRPAARFISQLKAAKKVVMEAEFFQEGDRQLTFETAGLNW